MQQINSPAHDPVGAQFRHPILADLTEHVQTLWSARRLILTVAATIVALALAAHVLLPARFMAETSVLIDPRNLNVVEKDVSPQSETSSSNNEVVESQRLVLVSDKVLLKLIEQENLANDIEFGQYTNFIEVLRGGVYGLFGISRKESDPKLRALARLGKAVDSTKMPESYVVQLNLTANGAEKAARLANGITQIYIDSEFEERVKLSSRASASLAARLEELRKSVQLAEDRVEKYKAEKQIVGAAGTLINEQQLAELNTKLVASREAVQRAQSRYDQLQELRRGQVSPEALSEAVDSPTIRELRLRYAAAQQREVALSTVLKPRHPNVTQVRAQVISLREQIEDELMRIAGTLRIELDRAKSDAKKLDSDLATLQQTALKTNQSLVALRELEREADAARNVYQAFLNRSRELGEQQRIDTSIARVISPAVPPRDPKGPSLPVLLVLASIFGVGLGAAAALAREGFNPSVHGARQLSRALPLPIAAALRLPAHKSASSKAGLTSQNAGVFKPEPRLAGEALSLFVIDHPLSPATAAVADLHKELVAERETGHSKTVLVTAAEDSAAKRAFSLNLALWASTHGDRVLLVDANPSSKGLSSVLKRDAETGLLEVISGEWDIADVVSVDETSTRLFLPLVTSKGKTVSVTADNLQKSVIEAAEGIDLIIFDGGVIGGDAITHAAAEVASTILIVAQARATRLKDLSLASQSFGAEYLRRAALVLIEDTH